MSHKSFERDSLLAEVYYDVRNSMEQVRFIRSSIADNGDPKKEVLKWDTHSFFADAIRSDGGETSTSLGSLLEGARKNGSFESWVADLYDSGAALLSEQKIKLPKNPIGSSKLRAYHKRLLSRDPMMCMSLRRGMIVAAIRHDSAYLGRVRSRSLVKFSSGDELRVTVEPNPVTDGYLSYGFRVGSDSYTVSNHTQKNGGLQKFEVNIDRGNDFRFIRVTLDDLMYVATFVPEEMDETLEKVHYPIMDTDLGQLFASGMPLPKQVATVVKYVSYCHREYPGDEEYFKACNFLIENRTYLKGKVVLYAPSDCEGKGWAAIRDATLQRTCDCLNAPRILTK